MHMHVLPNGISVSNVEIAAVVLNLIELLKENERTALNELAKKSKDSSFALSSHATQLLYAKGMASQDGSVHGNILAIVTFVLQIDDDSIQVVNLWQTAEEQDGMQKAVDSLSLAELATLVMGVSMSGVISSLMGYAKVSQFCKEGVASPELRKALFEAADRRIK